MVTNFQPSLFFFEYHYGLMDLKDLVFQSIAITLFDAQIVTTLVSGDPFKLGSMFL